MGCTIGKGGGFDAIFATNEFKNIVKELEPIKLNTKDLYQLYYTFDEILSAGEKSVNLTELLKYVGLPSTAFLIKIFSILNSNKSGEIDFKDYVLCLWNYCTLTKHNLGDEMS